MIHVSSITYDYHGALEHRGDFPHGPPSTKPWAANLQICVVFGVYGLVDDVDGEP